VLNPIRVFRSSFGGETVYQNPEYQSPNEVKIIFLERVFVVVVVVLYAKAILTNIYSSTAY